MGSAERARVWAYGSVLVLTLGFLGAFLVGSGIALPDASVFLGRDARPAPDFEIDLANGGTFRLSDARGEVVVLDLMAVDCASCRITEKAMLELHRERPEALIVSVDIWTDLEDEAYLHQHMQRLGADWPYGMDTDEVLFKYDAYEISKVVVIDPDGYVTWSKVGGIAAGPVIAAVDEAASGLGARQSTLGLGLVGFAVFAGVASFFAPCAFPLLPGYMAYALALGRRREGDGPLPTARVRDAIVPGAAAAGGILIVYGVFGLIVAAFGEAASPWLPYLQPFVGLVAIALGASLLLGASMERIIAPLQHGVERLRRRLMGGEREGTWVGYFSYGLGYGAAAAGCVAPVFLQLTLTAVAVGALTGLKVFAVYAGVAALLMVVATIVAVKARGFVQRKAGTVVRVMNRVSGVFLVLAGIYLLWFFNRGFGLPGLGA